MAQIDFTVIYSGDNFERGAVSVRDLAPALVSLADLLAEADKFLNGSRTSTEVKVFPDFTEGSFEVHLLLSQISTDTAIAVFSSFAITDPNGLLTTVFDTAKGVLAIFKLLKGKKPEQGQITVTENYGTVNVNNVKITVDASAATLYSNDRVRESVDHFAESIATRSLDEVQVVKDGKLIGELTRDR